MKSKNEGTKTERQQGKQENQGKSRNMKGTTDEENLHKAKRKIQGTSEKAENITQLPSDRKGQQRVGLNIF